MTLISEEEFDEIWDKFSHGPKMYNAICQIENYGACSGHGCPVNYGNEMTEMSQNYGCLPSPYQIAKMKAVEGKTWACHADNTKPCLGGLHLCKAMGLSTKIEVLETE